MARTNNLTNFLNDVATSIKQKLGDNTPIPASQFDTKIGEIETGGNYQTKSISITTNGNYTQLPDTGYDAMDQVTISVTVPGPDLSDATAQPKDILLGKTAYNGNGKQTGTFYGAQLFETYEAMQQNTDATEGDLAVVYREEIQLVQEDSEFDSCIFPNTVVLDEAFSDEIYGSFRSTGSGYFDGMVDMSSSSFRFDGFGDEMVKVTYTSQDGITYTRTDGGEELQEFGVTIKYEPMEPWNDVIGNFMKIKSNYYNGLYAYSPYMNNTYIRCCADLFNIIKDGSFITNEQWAYNNSNLTGSWAVCQYTTSQYKDIHFITMTDGYSITTSSPMGINGVVLVYDEYISKYFVGFCNANSTPPASYNDVEVIHFYNNENHTEHHSCTYFNTYRTSQNYIYNLYTFDDIEISQNFVNHLTYYFSSGSGQSEIGYIKINSNTNSIVEEPLYFYYVTDKFYHDMKYFTAKSQLDATNEYVFSKAFYGKDGADNGILQNGVIINNTIKNIYTHIGELFTTGLVVTDGIKFSGLSFTELPFMLNTSNVTNMENMFSQCTNLITIPLINTSNTTTMDRMFSGCEDLTTIPLLDTINVTSMQEMFSGCASLTTVPLLNTSNVTSFWGMFSGCSSITSIPQFNMSNVGYMGYMFYNCTSLTDTPTLDTSTVTNFYSTFQGCTALTNVSLFNTSNAETVINMFRGCTRITTIPQFNLSSVTTTYCMFYDCTGLTTVPTFDLSSVTWMENMFKNCTSLSNTSLNNILAMCPTVSSSYTRQKTLKHIGLTQSQATTCQSLSNYSAFIAAGWTTGY